MVFPEKDNSIHRLVVIAGCLVRMTFVPPQTYIKDT